jgi:phosphate:Na+ symporter
VSAILGDNITGKRADLQQIQSAINATQAYIDDINITDSQDSNMERIVSTIHTMDHIQRLHERCEEDEDRAVTARDTPELREECILLTTSIREIISDIEKDDWESAHKTALSAGESIHVKVRPFRASVMRRIAGDEIDINKGTSSVEAVRWLRRVSRHITRITQHTHESLVSVGKSEKEII